MISDSEHLTNIEQLTEACEDAVRRGNRTVRLELPAIGWLAIFDEIRNRRPRNYSSLLHEDLVTRLNEAIDRLHDEAAFVLANGPREYISDAFTVGKPRTRDIASPELRKAMRDKRGE